MVYMGRDMIGVLGGSSYLPIFLKYGSVQRYEDGATNDGTYIHWARLRALVFTGGADVDPALYGEPRLDRSATQPMRDIGEQKLYQEARRRNIPCIGICRGAQFLTVMNGGKLVQDITNHAMIGTHPMLTPDGREIMVNSTHHQMMLPCDSNHRMLGWAVGRSAYYDRGLLGKEEEKELIVNKAGEVIEPEVVLYPATKSLAVQYHPETMATDSEGAKYFHALVERHIHGTL